MGGACTVVLAVHPYSRVKRSTGHTHTHTPTENITPDTDSRVNLAMCAALEVYWLELGGAECPWGVV